MLLKYKNILTIRRIIHFEHKNAQIRLLQNLLENVVINFSARLIIKPPLSPTGGGNPKLYKSCEQTKIKFDPVAMLNHRKMICLLFVIYFTIAFKLMLTYLRPENQRVSNRCEKLLHTSVHF